MNVKLT